MTGGGGGADLDVITAEADDILSGKVIVDKDGNPLTGTLTLSGDAGAGAVAGHQRQGGTGQPRQLPAVWPKPGEAAQPSGGPVDRRF